MGAMAKIVFAMNVSLDGYVDHDRFMPGPGLFRHWIECVRTTAGDIGQDNAEIFGGWLKLSEDEMSELARKKVI